MERTKKGSLMNYLYFRKSELEKEINSYEPPLWYSQVRRRDELIKELKEVRLQIILKEYENAKNRGEQTVKAIYN